MPIVINSPNMDLPVPVVSQEPGPQYATDVNNALNIIDGHNHTSGSGVLIPTAGLNINADLTFNGFNAIDLRTARFQNQLVAPSAGSDVGCLYELSGDFWYNNGAGVPVQITSGGSVVGGAGSISGLPSGTASAAYLPLAATFRFQSATNTAANIDVRNVILRNAGAGSFGLTLSPPTLGADEILVLPAVPASLSLVTLDSSGNFGTTSADILNLVITGQFQANGPYRVGTFVDGILPFNVAATIKAIWIYNYTAGVSGTTEFDILTASSGGSFSSILTTTGKITSAAASNIWTDSNSVIGTQTGVTKPVVASGSIPAGNVLRFDILQAMPGASNCGVIVQYIPT